MLVKTSLYAGLSSAQDTITLLLRRLRDKIKDIMEDRIPKTNKPKPRELVNTIIPLERAEKEDLEPNEYIDHTCHDTPGISTLGKFVI